MSLFLTAILPPHQLAEEIDEIRKEISIEFDVFAALKPPVHITLYKPLKLDLLQEKVLSRILLQVSMLHQPFLQKLESFGSFNNKTIFIQAEKNDEIKELQATIAGLIRRNNLDTERNTGNSTFHPHLTIAYRDVTPEKFPTIWNKVKNRKFKRSYLTDRVCLLKHDGTKWNTFEEYPLAGSAPLQLF